ncbi:MAG TPA: hypothetical protein VI893_05215 [Thermoplasmata archaeon]|nr:hypothetical protein [Thermoplasmata archaeon]
MRKRAQLAKKPPFELPVLVVGEDTTPLEAEVHRLGAHQVSCLEVEHDSMLGVADIARAMDIDVIAYREEADGHTLLEILDDFGVEQCGRVFRMMNRAERVRLAPDWKKL